MIYQLDFVGGNDQLQYIICYKEIIKKRSFVLKHGDSSISNFSKVERKTILIEGKVFIVNG